MHDWTKVEPTISHHFHQRWVSAIADVLIAGKLPPGLSALLEQYQLPWSASPSDFRYLVEKGHLPDE